MTDTEIVDILGQIRNRVELIVFVIQHSPDDAPIRRCLPTLCEDCFEDCTVLVESICVVCTEPLRSVVEGLRDVAEGRVSKVDDL